MPLLPAVQKDAAASKTPPHQFLKTSAKVTKAGVTITLPHSAVEGLGIENGEVTNLYWLLMNGIIQLSAHQPSLFIPATEPKEEDFVRQGAGD